MTQYMYKGIPYTLPELCAASRRKQFAMQAAIEAEDWPLSFVIQDTDEREYLRQPGTIRHESGYNRTLTAPQKCGIIQSIKRIAQKIRREIK